jgi:hypothetical protein
MIFMIVRLFIFLLLVFTLKIDSGVSDGSTGHN